MPARWDGRSQDTAHVTPLLCLTESNVFGQSLDNSSLTLTELFKNITIKRRLQSKTFVTTKVQVESNTSKKEKVRTAKLLCPRVERWSMVDTGELARHLSARAKDFSIDSLISRSQQQMPFSDDSCNESCCSEEPLLSPPLLSPLGEFPFFHSLLFAFPFRGSKKATGSSGIHIDHLKTFEKGMSLLNF
ncbi:hypothetical protein CDAR_244721 [Caerostris darwini]|uniref:Uncharacterized protein n=1 Tax=Caerostris darwini TaxID=1538125 RepID=A0AAV4MQD0_9ARAC|nr:hypothetical protein CDAR_244721 [Caerostris darwini]